MLYIMLQATLKNQGLNTAKVTETHNHFRDPKYNYNEVNITEDIDYYREPLFQDNAKLSNINTIKNPLKPANVFVGIKNIKPLLESKGFTGLEHLASGRNNRNILPYVNTFSNKQYYTYV